MHSSCSCSCSSSSSEESSLYCPSITITERSRSKSVAVNEKKKSEEVKKDETRFKGVEEEEESSAAPLKQPGVGGGIATRREEKEVAVTAKEDRAGRRCSRRIQSGQKVNTSRLRRFNQLFWKNDSLYTDTNDTHCRNTTTAKINRKRPRVEEEKNKFRTGRNDNNNNNNNNNVYLNFGKRLHLQKIHDSPHIYIIDNFLTEAELRHLDHKIDLAESRRLFRKSFVDDSKKIRGPIEDSCDSTLGKSNLQTKNGDVHSVSTDVEPLVETSSLSSTSDTSASENRKPQQQDLQQRTSTFIHFSKLSDSKIASIENRAAELLSLPNHCIEPLQLVRYTEGQYFRDHHDMGVLYEDGTVQLPPKFAFSPPRRLATLFVYLNDLPHRSCGGSTRFPLLDPMEVRRGEDEVHDGNEMPNQDKERCDEFDCGGSSADESGAAHSSATTAPRGLDIFPKRGRAVLFCNIDRHGMPDPRTVHAGQPLKRPIGSCNVEKSVEAVSIPVAGHRTVGACCEDVEAADLSAVSSRITKFRMSLPVVKYGINIWACEE